MSWEDIKSLTRARIRSPKITENRLKFDLLEEEHIWGVQTLSKALEFLVCSENHSQATQYNSSLLKKVLKKILNIK